MGGSANYNPVKTAGADDALDPVAVGGRQLYKKLTATAKNPIPLNLARLGAGTVGGIVAESTTQNLLDATRGGNPNPNPYLASLEKLGGRMIGGATSGAIYGKNPASVIAGAIGGAAIDAGENIYGIATGLKEIYDIYRDIEISEQRQRTREAQRAWKKIQAETKQEDKKLNYQGFPTKHPSVKNPDGSESNVKLGTFGIDGKQYVIPTMVDGKTLNPNEALDIAKSFGFDKYPSFNTVSQADEWAKKYHGRVNAEGKINY